MKSEIPKFGLLKAPFVLGHVVLPICIGALIYTLWRKHTLLVFSWYDFVGLAEPVNHARGSVTHFMMLCLTGFSSVYLQ